MSSSIKLTKRTVDAAAPSTSRVIVWDTDLKGFGLRVEPTGVKTFIVRYRPGEGGRAAPKRFVTIGRYGTLTPDEARQQARDVLATVAKGGDPAASRDKSRAALTFSALSDAFLTEHVETKRKPATASQYRHLLSLIRPEIGSRRAEEITKADILRLHHHMRETPFLANRMVAAVGSLFGWAASQHHVPEGFNPAAKVEKYPEDRRERFLSLDELDRLGAALRLAETDGLPWTADETKPKAKHAPRPENRRVIMSPDATAAIRLLLLTGAGCGKSCTSDGNTWTSSAACCSSLTPRRDARRSS
ncbi:integrase family protein [Micromonospora sp. STR1s_5]|nr:integrase family protein [Micromonospora sp. STR1s_5]